jgi:DNA-binding response OmpR family regulator
MSRKTILVLDREPLRRRLHVFGLRCAGFSTAEAADHPGARAQIARFCPHLVLIAATLLDFDVENFVRALRGDVHTRELPVVALVDRDHAIAAESALACGIDDYVVGPLPPEVFIARIAAVVGRRPQSPDTLGPIARLTLDAERGGVCWDGRFEPLGPTEQRVLELFLTYPGRLLPRELLLFRVWSGDGRVAFRAVDVGVCRLRRALARLGCAELLQTVRREGYRLAQPARGQPSRERHIRVI